MRGLIALGLAAGLLLQAPAFAEEKPLGGAAVKTLLSGHSVAGVDDGGPWTQSFAADGGTVHKQGSGQSEGIWDVRGDQYCSRWPPGDSWTCFDMAREGDDIVFIAKSGKRYKAHFTS